MPRTKVTDTLEQARERVINEAINYASARLGTGSQALQDAVDDLINIAQATALASIAQAALNAASEHRHNAAR